MNKEIDRKELEKKMEEQNVVPIADGETHLQNLIVDKRCYICKKEDVSDCVLLRTDGKKMGFACTDHVGVVQEFIKQFRAAPLGWRKTDGDSVRRESGNSEKTGSDNPV